MAKLTDKSLAQSTAITPTTLVHIVVTGDTSQSGSGSSYAAKLEDLTLAYGTTTFTGISLSGLTTYVNNMSANTVSATTLVIKNTFTPSGSTDTSGVVGTLVWDNNYLYLKRNSGWVRFSGQTW